MLVESGVSWLGKIPSHWEMSKIGHCFNHRNEIVSDKDFEPLSVTKNGVLPQLETAAKSDNSDGRKLIRKGDFVINQRSDRKGSAGVSPLDGSCSVIYTVLEPVRYHPPYAHHLFRSSGFQEEFYRWGTGIVDDLWSTRYSLMKQISCPVPPIEEQREIANFLDQELSKIDLLMDSYQRLESVLFERWKAKLKTALDPLTGENEPLLFQAVPHHWRAGHLKHFADVVLGKMVEKLDSEENSEMFPYLRAASIQRYGELRLEDAYSMPFSAGELNKYSLRRDDVVVVEGGSIGRAALVQETLTGWGFQNSVNRLRPKRGVHGAYLAFVMQYIEMSGIYKTIVNTSTISHLTAEKLQVVRVAFPQFDEQLELSQALQVQLDRLKKASLDVQNFKALLTERRSALIDAAVTGKIDIRGKK